MNEMDGQQPENYQASQQAVILHMNRVKSAITMTTSNVSCSKPNSNEVDIEEKLFSNASGVTSQTNWQAQMPNVKERNAAMFNNSLMSDISFNAGLNDSRKIIPAHKYILSTGSSVFFAMFYGEMAEKTNEIKIPDVEPLAFLTLLRYLYCDEILLNSDNVLSTLYAAKKYMMPHLTRACVRYLETSLSASNACILLSQGCLFDESELTKRCWEVIDAQAELALASEGFQEIDLRTVTAILQRETLNIKETKVFDAVLHWSKAECKRKGWKTNRENCRKAIGQVLYKIRIPTMSVKEFADGPAALDLLTQEEVINIFMWYSASTKPQLPFPTVTRKGLTPQICHRFQSTAFRSNQWRYRGRCDSIQFMSKKRIFLAGFGLYGSSSGAAKYSANIKLSLSKETLAEEVVSFFTDGCSKTFPVWFSHPVQCEPEVFYTASVVLGGNELSFFGQEGMAEVICGDVTIQFQCSSDSTNGTGVQGGQIPELIFYFGSE